MNNVDSIETLFDELIADETEKKIIRMIIQGKESETILEKMLLEKAGGKND